MSETVFTFPGKAGDAIMQFPIAYWWAKENGKQFTCWMDEKTCKIVAPLFAAQPCVEKVEFKPGIESWHAGGQPFHFSLPTSEFENRTVFHLGYRAMPQRQLTFETLEHCKVQLNVDRETLAETPVFVTPDAPKARRCVIHGQPVYAHTRSTPTVWKFIASIRKELESRFEEIVFVGNDRDRAVGLSTYPDWKEFSDGGNFKHLADYLAASELVIGCGSSVAALGGALKVPTVRVHDPIGDTPKVIFANLGKNQLNATEPELRAEWPAFRDQWLTQPVAT